MRCTGLELDFLKGQEALRGAGIEEETLKRVETAHVKFATHKKSSWKLFKGAGCPTVYEVTLGLAR